MNKKSIIIFSFVFVSIIFFVLSCNKPDASTSATQVPEPIKESKGLTNYAGVWKAIFANNSNFDLVIEGAEDVLYNNNTASLIEDLGSDKYKVNISAEKPFSIILKFTSDIEGTVEDDNFGIGTLEKIE